MFSGQMGVRDGWSHTVAKALLQLQDLGLVREQTGRQRHRRFVYERYLAILNQGTEPIAKGT